MSGKPQDIFSATNVQTQGLDFPPLHQLWVFETHFKTISLHGCEKERRMKSCIRKRGVSFCRFKVLARSRPSLLNYNQLPFFSELKKICTWPGYFSSTWLWRKLISVQGKVNSGKRVFVHPPHSRAVIKQLKMWYITSNSIHSSMTPLMWVGENISRKMNLKWLHRSNALWLASGDGWSSMADAPDKCSRSGTIFPNINSEMTFFVCLRMKAWSHTDLYSVQKFGAINILTFLFVYDLFDRTVKKTGQPITFVLLVTCPKLLLLHKTRAFLLF